MSLRHRHLICAGLVVVASASVPTAAPAAETRVCKSADLRYPFRPGGPKTFGVFKMQVTGGSCTTAHAVAKRWQDLFEAEIQEGRVRLPRRVSGFRFRSLPPTEAQTYRLRGRRDDTTIRFDYRVPNG